jgi:TDG/mug DNA glycosylase family protein
MVGGLPDVLAPDLSVVFCGLNPGVSAAATGHHFVGRGNRFWQVIHLAKFTPIQIDPEDDASVLSFGLGLTTVVERPTASATELGVQKLNTELNAALQNPKVRDVLRSQGLEIIGNSPNEFRKEIEDEIELWAKVIKDSGITAQQ